MYRCDLQPILEHFRGAYEMHLNSEDVHDMDLPLTHPKAKGGTCIMWKTSISPFVKILPTSSPSFVSVMVTPPGILPSVHTAVYLPTAGKDGEWLATLVELEDHVMMNVEKYGDLAIFLRGDFNGSGKNKTRFSTLSAVISRLKLAKVKLPHPTYHHFTGCGESDSDLDLLLYGGGGGGGGGAGDGLTVEETLVNIQCKFQHPLMFSHHDLIVSTCSIPPVAHDTHDEGDNITAPRVPNLRFKTRWSEEGVTEYSDVISTQLRQIRDTWGNMKHNNSSISLLLSTTFSAMNIAAKATNEVSMLGEKKERVKPKTSQSTKAAAKTSFKLLQKLSRLEGSQTASEAELDEARLRLHISRLLFKKIVRKCLAEERDIRDRKLYDIISNPSAAFSALRAGARSTAPAVKRMQVGDKVYMGESVADGLFDSLSSLKSPDMTQYNHLPPYAEAVSVYQHIMKLASAGGKIPQISFSKGEKLLRGLKSSVIDYFSITSLHFLHLGHEGVLHFIFLLNVIIGHINSSCIEELNTIWANILHKGSGKDRESDRSYRTISCCPLLAKALDIYMVELYDDGWSAAQASTQFQGSNSSHELASLSITEAVCHGLHVNKQPVYTVKKNFFAPESFPTINGKQSK